MLVLVLVALTLFPASARKHPPEQGTATYFPLKSIVYILPYEICSDYWFRKYGDRIYYYVYGNLSQDKWAIEEDFQIISSIYRFVIIVLPAEDSKLYFKNLNVINQTADEFGLRVIYAIFPKEKYGREDRYLDPGSKMHKLVLRDMKYLLSLNATYKVAIWYGWEYRDNAEDIVNFYFSLPEGMRPGYAIWLDEGYTESAEETYELGLPENVLVITELYSKNLIKKYSGLYPNQMVVTGYSGASSLKEWRNGIESLLFPCKTWKVGIWIFYDIGDGNGEKDAAFIDGGLSDFLFNPIIKPHPQPKRRKNSVLRK